MLISRREFVGAALTATVVGCTSQHTTELPSAPYSGPIIDTHVHVWDLQQFNLRWLTNAGPRLKHDFTPADYLKAIEGTNVTKAVYVEVDVAPGQEDAEAAYAVELCRTKASPILAAIVGGNPAAAEFATYIRKHKANAQVKGVRESYRRGGCDDPAFLAGVRLLGELGMTFDLLMGPDLLPEAARLVDACPQTRFVLDHCGNPDVKWFASTAGADAARRRAWEAAVAQLAQRPNVVCKISGVAESADDGQVTPAVVAPPINHCLDQFGPDRVMFASNWPVCLKTITLRDWLAVLREVVQRCGESFVRKLFHDNATRFYNL